MSEDRVLQASWDGLAPNADEAADRAAEAARAQWQADVEREDERMRRALQSLAAAGRPRS